MLGRKLCKLAVIIACSEAINIANITEYIAITDNLSLPLSQWNGSQTEYTLTGASRFHVISCLDSDTFIGYACPPLYRPWAIYAKVQSVACHGDYLMCIFYAHCIKCSTLNVFIY